MGSAEPPAEILLGPILTVHCVADGLCFEHALGQYIVGSLIIRIGFGGPLYYIYNKEPKIVLLII